MKSRKIKEALYEEKFGDIPKDDIERLDWLINKYNISNDKISMANDILGEIEKSTFYEVLIILYEEPEGSPRPRFRIVNRNKLFDSAVKNSSFVHVYSVVGHEDQVFMKRFLNENDIEYLKSIISSPIEIIIDAYFRTPSYYNSIKKYLCELKAIKPVTKPDWDNIGKKYSDMFNNNIWIDDKLVVDGRVRKFYSVLPRVEIHIRFYDKMYTKEQSKTMMASNGVDIGFFL